MMRLFAAALLVLGSVCAAQAQETAPAIPNDKGTVGLNFTTTTAPKTMFLNLSSSDTIFLPATGPALTFDAKAPAVATALAVPLDMAEPPAPSPKPKFLYGGRDDYRWQLSLGAAFYRFQSSLVNASAVGFNTSVNYFLNDWFGIEGNVSPTFAPKILVREHVKLLTYGGGPKIAWRQKQWEPWLHGLFGGAHEQPQFAGVSRNTYSIQAGGGADYRWTPRVAFRLEGDYVRTGFFKQSQNNFQVVAGIVFHF
jgi:opacity protein-like surface antigen